MFSKEEAKQKVAELIEDFNKHPRKETLSEEDTRTFIGKLFEILGWNFRSDEVNQEEHIKSKGYVDYGFRINGLPVLFVEAKRVAADLNEEKFVHQATDYAWHKATTWAVLTNFKRIRIFNAYIKESIRAAQLRDLEISEYLEQFDSLWLLSKESFETKLIDKKAEEEGKKSKEKPVVKQLFEDFNKWRELIAKEIKKNYESKYSTEEIDEMIQLLLDRLILIRKIEDEGLESRKIEECYNIWLSQSKKDLWKYLRELFFDFDGAYNSKIFSYHELDKLEIGDYPLKMILPELYESRDRTIRYNFSFIDADILGSIYEQYLGYLLKTTAKRATGEASNAKRKEQGIYYTPRYIVEYIVKNTLGEKLKECKTLEDVENIRVLDPACGSGSFLIRAFDEIHGWYESKGLNKEKMTLTEHGFATVKDKIIKQNLFGVDLDPKAVELAQLNLLIKTADRKHKLPILQENIKCGNSLIDDPAVAGDNAFKWENQFEQIMKNGGFDVIIGNPPYVRQEELLQIKTYLQNNYEVFHSMSDLFVYFFEKEIKLLKENGYFGMIVSNKWFKTGYGQNLRKFIQKYRIEVLIDFGDLQLFEGATTYPCILIIRKQNKLNTKIKVCQVKTLSFNRLDDYVKKNTFEVNQNILDEKGWNFQNDAKSALLNKIKLNCKPLKEYVGKEVYRGILTGLTEVFVISKEKRDELIREDSKSLEVIKPFLTGKEVRRYGINFKEQYIILTKNGIDIKKYPAIFKYLSNYKQALEKRWDQGNHWYELRACDYYELFQKPKIIYGKITTMPRFTIDNNGYYANDANFFMPTSDKKLLGILNSKLGWFMIANTCTEIQGGYQLIWKYFGNVLITKENSPELEKLVDKMLSLNKRLSELGDKETNESKKLEEEIKRTDKEIDNLVYKLYEITEEEKKIIEESLLGEG